MKSPDLQPGDLVETLACDFYGNFFMIRARVLARFKNGRVRIEDVDRDGRYSTDAAACRVLRRATHPAPAASVASKINQKQG